MSATTQPLPDSMNDEIERGTWLDFACVILVLTGFFNVIAGLSMINNSSYINDRVLFGNLHAWGWFYVAWGILQAFAGIAAFRGARWAVLWALFIAFVNAIGQLSSAATYPVWSISILALDVFIIYGLSTSGVLRRRTA
jgi:hypothetical protein